MNLILHLRPAAATAFPAGPASLRAWALLGDEIAAAARMPGGLAMLSDAERQRSERFRQEGDRQRFVAARILLRTMLCAATGVAGHLWDIIPDAKGRPLVAGPPGHTGLRFSITHTDGLIACAMAEGLAVGIDAEAHDPSLDVEAIARRFFASAEADALERTRPALRRAAFFDLWTLKEAYLKAGGDGLPAGLDQAVFEIGDGAVLTFCPPFAAYEVGAAWRFGVCRPTGRHTLALAVGSDLPGIDVLEVPAMTERALVDIAGSSTPWHLSR